MENKICIICESSLSPLMNYCYCCGQEHLLENEFDFDECKCGAEVHPKFNFCYACGRDISEDWNNVIKRAKGFKLEWECNEGCGGSVQEFMSYCPWCGEEQYWKSFYSDDFKCNHCEVNVSQDWQYCPFCGTKIKWERLLAQHESDDVRQLLQEYESAVTKHSGLILEMKEVKNDIINFYDIKSSLKKRKDKFDYSVTKMLSRYGLRNLSIRAMMDKEWDAIVINYYLKFKTIEYLRKFPSTPSINDYEIVKDAIPSILTLPGDILKYQAAKLKVWNMYTFPEDILKYQAAKLKVWNMYTFKVRNMVYNNIIGKHSKADIKKKIVLSNRNKYKPWSEASSHYIRDYAFKNGHDIYDWMKKHGIGESDYGKYLDALGRRPGVFHHRLYGHHPIYDFPFTEPENIPEFLEHVLLSDFFTKQGLPIIPGEIIDATQIKVIFNRVSKSWNFINGFDLLAGTLAVYNSYKISADYFNQNASIEKIDTLAKQLGISGIHVALALSTANPLLIISSIISTAGTLVGVLNCPHKIYFRKIANQYSVVVAVEEYDINKVIESYDIDNVVSGYDIDNADY